MSRCLRASILSAAGLRVVLGWSELPMSSTLRCSVAASSSAAALAGEERLAGLQAEGSGACQGRTAQGVGAGLGCGAALGAFLPAGTGLGASTESRLRRVTVSPSQLSSWTGW